MQDAFVDLHQRWSLLTDHLTVEAISEKDRRVQDQRLHGAVGRGAARTDDAERCSPVRRTARRRSIAAAPGHAARYAKLRAAARPAYDRSR